MRKRRGFTLLEMIVATALMSIAVVGLLSLLTVSLSNGARARHYDRAAMLARTKMNELLVAPRFPLGQPWGGQWDAATGWSASAEPFEQLPGALPGAEQLVRITLQVWWTYQEQRQSVALEGYRRYTPGREGAR